MVKMLIQVLVLLALVSTHFKDTGTSTFPWDFLGIVVKAAPGQGEENVLQASSCSASAGLHTEPGSGMTKAACP